MSMVTDWTIYNHRDWSRIQRDARSGKYGDDLIEMIDQKWADDHGGEKPTAVIRNWLIYHHCLAVDKRMTTDTSGS